MKQLRKRVRKDEMPVVGYSHNGYFWGMPMSDERTFLWHDESGKFAGEYYNKGEMIQVAAPPHYDLKEYTK